jgi:hypothetical protein
VRTHATQRNKNATQRNAATKTQRSATQRSSEVTMHVKGEKYWQGNSWTEENGWTLSQRLLRFEVAIGQRVVDMGP